MKTIGSSLWDRLLSQMLSLATVFAIVLAGAPGPAFAQARGTSPQKAAAETSSAKNARSHGGEQQEGIKVHGDWTIVVRNADGSVASQHQFRNALTAPQFLSRLLARQGSVGEWRIFLQANPAICRFAANPTTGFPGLPADCVISDANPPASRSDWFTTLTVSIAGSGPDPNALVLTGSIKAAAAGGLLNVFTAVSTCPATTAPSPTCAHITNEIFTTKDVSALSIAVVAGQTIDVTVKISFS